MGWNPVRSFGEAVVIQKDSVRVKPIENDFHSDVLKKFSILISMKEYCWDGISKPDFIGFIIH